ncbi:DUF6279 family lipoprotein [Noviherbaspirillum sp.]|uniref:DUF6279 family lipoprotein n=1 Tax=Noviherbaspirillum sp. TaxID=1926288 RepID=UPI002D2BB77A|nr:DUF6279 family lipoprotein [Noviherbaspirillum sp.]HZW22309.1 DUF6279 family lipoprotein [Noviherbaspirillum sp.]
MRPDRAFFERAVLFLLAMLLAGCSALRLGYANGDTFVYWWLNGYVDFEDEQKPWVKAHIDRLFDWHRTTQLPDYAQLLEQVQQRLQRGQTAPDEVRADFNAVRKRAALVLDKAAPELADLALSLQPQQIANLEKKFSSNNDKYRKEYLRGNIDDRQQLRFKKVMKQAEYWFGDFSQEQEASIRKMSDARPLDYEIWMAERLRRQQEMLQMLRKIQAEKPPRETVSRMIREFVARSFENFTYAENKAFFDDSTDGMARMIATIVNVATPEQKAHAIKRLQKWIEDCHALAGKA